MLHVILAAAISHSLRSPIQDVKAKLTKQGFSKTEISRFFSDERLKIYSQKTIASKPVDWNKYQAQILQTDSVDLGAQFIKDHQASFVSAEQTYGVPKEIIAAVMRIETGFGRYTGTYVVPDVFYSFLRHGKRIAWAENNLVDCLVYAKREKLDPFKIKGSYDGAIGYPQFLPVSIMAYGIDGNADGHVNLMQAVDAIPSLANFLQKHGFNNDQKQALTSYYGSSHGYPDAAIAYAGALVSSK